MRRVVLAFVALIACASLPVEPPPRPSFTSMIERFDATTLMLRIEPPGEYEQWRDEIEACSGLTSDVDDSFWIVPRRYLVMLDENHGIVGEHIWQTHKIIFALGWEVDANTVRHELLHHLLSVAGDTINHDPAYFQQRCGALVK